MEEKIWLGEETWSRTAGEETEGKWSRKKVCKMHQLDLILTSGQKHLPFPTWTASRLVNDSEDHLKPADARWSTTGSRTVAHHNGAQQVLNLQMN